MINVYLSKSDCNLAVDWDAMPDNAKQHIIEYGLRQKLNDAGSSATVKELGKDEAAAQAKAMAENVLEALMAGRVTVRTATAKIDRFMLQALKDIYKVAVGGSAKDADTMHEAIIKAKGCSEATLEAAIAKRAGVLKAQWEAMQAIKAQAPSIEL